MYPRKQARDAAFEVTMAEQCPTSELSAKQNGDVPHYAAAQRELAAAYEWAAAGFPGATLEQVIAIATNLKSEREATDIRLRAENECKSMLGLPVRKPRRRQARGLPPDEEKQIA
jgi:hypothetical protein